MCALEPPAPPLAAGGAGVVELEPFCVPAPVVGGAGVVGFGGSGTSSTAGGWDATGLPVLGLVELGLDAVGSG